MKKQRSWERFDAPKSIIELAQRRTLFLRNLVFEMRMDDIAINAYVQGMTDGLEAAERIKP